MRNPFRFGFDPNLDQLIIGDVGQNNIEEIDLGVSGKNYGWNKKEGTFLFNHDDGTILPDGNPDPLLTRPVPEDSHLPGPPAASGLPYPGALRAPPPGRPVGGGPWPSGGWFSMARAFSAGSRACSRTVPLRSEKDRLQVRQ